MSRRATAWLAWAVCAVNLTVLALALIVILLGWSTEPPKGGYSWWGQATGVIGLIGAPVLGALIASRRAGNPYGWLWLGYGLGFAFSALVDAYTTYADLGSDSGALPVPWIILLVGNLGWGIPIVLIPFLLLLFPDGTLPSPRWRFLAWTVAVTGTLTLSLGPFLPYSADNPLTIGGPVGVAINIMISAGVMVTFAAIVLSALSLVIRYRRAAGVQRQQLKWFAYAATVLAAWIVVDVGEEWFGLSEALLGAPLLTLLTVVSFTGIYVAVGFAVLRYRLYDIDIIINRTLVYGSLTLMLALVYFGSVTATQALFQALTSQERLPQLVVVASTLLIAALFTPLRRRIQSFIDRSFYRRKYDAGKTLEAFSAKLRDKTDLEALNNELVGVVKETMQPAHVSLWLRPSRRVVEDAEEKEMAIVRGS
jgi:hypothetical protein